MRTQRNRIGSGCSASERQAGPSATRGPMGARATERGAHLGEAKGEYRMPLFSVRVWSGAGGRLLAAGQEGKRARYVRCGA
jgi:hypothetical protein